MNENLPPSPVFPTGPEVSHPIKPEDFANRYGNMLLGQRTLSPDGTEKFTPPEPHIAETPYGVESAVGGRDIGKLHQAIGEVLLDVGMKTGDETLKEDAGRLFNVTTLPAATAGEIAAREFANSQWRIIEDSEKKKRKKKNYVQAA